MSRSRNKVAGAGFCNSKSMKLWKRGANKKLRSKSKQLLNTHDDWDSLLLPHRDEVDSRWNSPMDGKPYIIWEKPDDNECFRWFYSHYRGLWRFEPEKRERMQRSLEQTGHLERNLCDCISNKNSSYWKSFRK